MKLTSFVGQSKQRLLSVKLFGDLQIGMHSSFVTFRNIISLFGRTLKLNEYILKYGMNQMEVNEYND